MLQQFQWSNSDPSLGLWNKLNIPDEVAYSSAAVTMQGFLYFVGGSGNRLRAVRKYNPDTNQWHTVCLLSSPRSAVCAVTDGSYLYAIGGIDQTDQVLNIVERFDPRKNTWENLPPMLARRADAGVQQSSKGCLYLEDLMKVMTPVKCLILQPTCGVVFLVRLFEDNLPVL